MNKTIKEVAKMMDKKINKDSNPVELDILTKGQVQIVDEFVTSFNKRISMFLIP